MQITLKRNNWLSLKRGQYISLMLVLAFVAASFGAVVAPQKAQAQVQGWTLHDCRNWTTWTSTYFKPGDSGGCVWTIQYFLKNWRYLSGLPQIRYDGKYGQETAQAVKQFQGAQRLSVDGLTGPTTLDKMSTVCFSWVNYPFNYPSPACFTF